MSQRRCRIQLARAYQAPEPDGSFRVLVDRVWPRGVKKDELDVDAWVKDLAPSSQLRKWFNHDAERWDEFRKRYFQELEDKPEQLDELLRSAGKRSLLLLFGARDKEHNNAVALRDFLQKHGPRRKR